MIGKAIAFIAIIGTALAAVPNRELTNVDMPPTCYNKTFCFEKSPNYPQELIDKIIADKLSKFDEVADKIETRGGAEKPDDDCERDISFEPIYEIIDKNGNVRFVAQSKEKLLQKIRTESCLSPGRITSSNFFNDSILNKFDFRCVESRIEYSFQVLSHDGTDLEDVDVKDGLPVCCACKLMEPTD